MYPAELDEGLADEDEGDEEGEDLLGEAGDEADQEASLEGHCDDHDDDEPKPNPDAARQVLDVVCFAELWGYRAKKTLLHPLKNFHSSQKNAVSFYECRGPT